MRSANVSGDATSSKNHAKSTTCAGRSPRLSCGPGAMIAFVASLMPQVASSTVPSSK